jgi:hypothetical protein
VKAHINRSILIRLTLIASLIGHLAIMSTRLHADSGSCGGATTTVPFTDVAGSIFFCSIAEAFFSGLTNGTTATTYSPSQDVPREQMAAFITRTLDQSLVRDSRRAALNQWWTPLTPNNIKLTPVGHGPFGIVSDGADLWIANYDSNTVSRVRASDGAYLGTWTGLTQPAAILAAEGLVFVTAENGTFYDLDPAQPPGAVVPQCQVGTLPREMTFDGFRFWTANDSGSVSIVSFDPLIVTTLTTGFSHPYGIIFDGSNIWVSDPGDLKLKKLDSNGNILLSADGCGGEFPAFDGTNIWVPGTFLSHTVFVVRAKGALSGTVLAQLTGNGLTSPVQAAFDGVRILVTNQDDSVSLWKASDLTPLGSFPTGAGTQPGGACSDGINFWISLFSGSAIARF